MSIVLEPDVEALVRREVASGRYASASEVVREGVEMLAEKDRWRKLELLRADIQAAEEEYNSGQFIVIKSEEDATKLKQEIMRRGRERLAARSTNK